MGQVLSAAKHEPTTNWPGPMVLHLAADLLDDAEVLMAHRAGPSTASIPR
jgi:hypothetical protein